jgi:hypothetical protein
MRNKEHVHNASVAFRAAKRPGASKKLCMVKQGQTTYVLEDFLTLEERVYSHHLLLECADEITERCDNADDSSPPEQCWSVLTNNPKGKNDNARMAANHCLENNVPLNNLVQNFVHLVAADECCGGATPFPCGGSGEEFSITLLVALVDALRQQEHTDYNPMYFQAHEDFDDLNFADEEGEEPYYHEELETSCDNFNGASMFINFSWNRDQKLDLDSVVHKTGHYKTLPLPAMSIVIIRGDLVHAGSANSSGVKTRKFFLYLDPHPDCRMKGVFKEGKGYVQDNLIFFGSTRKTVNGV